MYEISKPDEVILPENTSLNLVLAYHHTSADSERLKKYIDECDIYIPELDGWIPTAQDTLQSIADGDRPLYRYFMAQHNLSRQNLLTKRPDLPTSYVTPLEMLAKNVFDTKKKILIVDVPSGHTVTQNLREAVQIRFGELYNPDFKKALKAIASHANQEASSQTSRENYILNQIGPSITAAINNDPYLTDKDQINIVMTMGIFHTSLHHALLKVLKLSGTGVYKKITEPGDGIFGHRDELARRYQLGLPVGKLLIARAFADLDIINNLKSHPESGAELVKMVRTVSAQLTMPEIRALHVSAVQRKDTAIVTKVSRLLESAHSNAS